ncbi:unnamed protein product, partial [Oncorhynchus mykiss]
VILKRMWQNAQLFLLKTKCYVWGKYNRLLSTTLHVFKHSGGCVMLWVWLVIFDCCAISLFYRKANEGLLMLSAEETMPISIRQLAYVSGLGFGFMSGAFSMVNILADSVGPGTIGIHGDSQHYFLSSAFMTMAIILLHMFWGVVFFDSCEKQHWWSLAVVVISHLLVSCLTFQNPQYVGSLVPTYIIVFLVGLWAFFCSGGSLRNLKLCLTCKDKDFLLANHRPR